ncbi:MAG: NYN domain-containing protein [Candidatus Caenarcaniphilales bacterium]|nr:NYN domain-containing protein [Candidatus Caenarcaniphilales bacterium]
MVATVNFYIDGFNFYFPIRQFQEKRGICLKWLNYDSLCRSLLGEGEAMGQIYFFTAISESFGQASVHRHNLLISAYESFGIKVIKGNFKRQTVTCKVRGCTHPEKNFTKQSEKRTDINIALQIYEDAIKGHFEKAFLFSADSDFVPVIEKAHQLDRSVSIVPVTLKHFNHERQGFYYPPMNELKQACSGKWLPLDFKKLKRHIMPKVLYHQGYAIHMPADYQ